MKILYHHRIASRDGMDVHITELTRAFRELGHELRIVSPVLHQRADFGKGGELLSLVRRKLPKQVGELAELAYDHVAYRQLVAACREFEPDFLYERANLFLTAGLRLKQRFGVPYLLEVNAPLFIERSEYGGLGLGGIADRLERRSWRGADRVFPVSTVLAQIMKESGTRAECIEVLPNGANVEDFNPEIDGAVIRSRFGIGDGIVLGFCGFVRDWHRIDLLLDLAASLQLERNVHVLIVGDGPAAEELRAQALALGIGQRVHFTGLVGRGEIARFIAAFDIAIQPAATRYASPLKLVEYLAMAKPVIAPRMPNIVETVGEAGVVSYFNENDPESMIGAVKSLLDNLPAAGAEARARSKQVRTWKDNANSVVAAAQRIIDQRRGPQA